MPYLFTAGRRHALLPLLTLLCSQQVLAEQSENDFLSELPVVLSASRLAQPLAEAPAAVTVIDRDTIRQSGARELADLLRLVPGFQVTNRDQDPARAVYHGIGGAYPQRMQVLIDGRSQYSPFFIAGVNWNLLPVALDDIERIEVIRGSNSAAYGSNAFLGVVNITTRHPAETPLFTAEARSGGDVGDQMVRLAKHGEALDLRATYQRSHDTGLGDLFDNKDATLLDLRGDLGLSSQDSLQIGLGHLLSQIGQGSGKSTNPLRTPDLTTSYLQLHWRHALPGGDEMSLRFSSTEDQQKNNSFSISLPGGDGATSNSAGWARRNELEWQHILHPAAATRLVWGAGWYNERMHQPIQFHDQDVVSRQVMRLFGNLEWTFAPSWIANLGGTLEHDSAGSTNAAPRLMLNHHLAPGHTLRAGFSRAYRAASLYEQQGSQYYRTTNGILYQYDFRGQGQVAPERINSREIGYLGELPEYGLNIDARAFDEVIPNRIQTLAASLTPPNCELVAAAQKLTPCGDADYAVNGQRLETRGLEYQLRWKPLAGTQVVFNDTWLKIHADMTTQATSAPELLARINDQATYSAPSRSRSLLLTQALPGDFRMTAAFYKVGEMRWTQNSVAPSYTRLDWRLSHPFQAGATRGEVAFTVQADGAPHVEYRSSEIVTRRGFLTVRLEY
jgi:iron complex outermembrane receptor protein